MNKETLVKKMVKLTDEIDEEMENGVTIYLKDISVEYLKLFTLAQNLESKDGEESFSNGIEHNTFDMLVKYYDVALNNVANWFANGLFLGMCGEEKLTLKKTEDISRFLFKML